MTVAELNPQSFSMFPVTCAGHRLRFAEASALATEANTGLFVEDGFLDLRIPISRLTSIDAGIKEALIPRINQYSDALRGVLIAYSRLRLLSPDVDLSENLGAYQDIRVHGTFVVFRPDPGIILKGIVTRVTPYYMGCLVHRNFTASLHSDRKEINLHEVFKTGQEMLFQVVRLDNHSNICSIRGLVTRNLVQAHRPKRGSTLQIVQEGVAVVTELDESGPSSKIHKTSEKRKKCKIVQFDDTASRTPDSGMWSAPSSITSSAHDDVFSDATVEAQSGSGKKHKKRKRDPTEEQPVDNMKTIVTIEETQTVPEPQSSPAKKKKRKHTSAAQAGIASSPWEALFSEYEEDDLSQDVLWMLQ